MAVFDKAYGNWPEITSYLEKNIAGYKSTVLALVNAAIRQRFQ